MNGRRRELSQALQREQVLEGLAAAILEKGYAATTVADIARLGRVSKSAIYRHFVDTEDAFIALHAAITDRILARIAAAEDSAVDLTDWRQRIQHVIGSYVDAAADEPTYLPLALVEAGGAGPRARVVQRAAHDRFAERLEHISRDLADATPGVRPLTHDLALGAVGALNELVVRAAPDGPDALRKIEEPASDILIRLLRAE